MQSNTQDLKSASEREIKRMTAVFEKLKIVSKSKRAKEFYDFAHDYFSDAQFFIEKSKCLEAFEAAVIAWAYIDSGLKLGFFEVPGEHKTWFTA